MPDYIVSYAQNREDRIIEAFFPDVQKGFYVDVGANHPFYHSVTKIFYDKGWSGINIEPNPTLLAQFKQSRRRDTNLQLGVGAKKGNFPLRVYHSLDGLDGISTLSEDMKADYAAGSDQNTDDYTDMEIDVVTLASVFKDYVSSRHVHFIKIDVEGYEYEVLEGNDWTKFRPELICIEANHLMKDWRPILKKAKYFLVYNDGLNDYYLAEEAASRKDNFDYAKTFLGNKPIYDFNTSEKLRSAAEVSDHLHKEVEDLRKANEMQRQEIEKSHKLINEKDEYILEITPLKKHIKRQVRQRVQRRKG